MKMSIGVKELILREPSYDLQIKYQNSLNEILSTLDNNIDNLGSIRKQLDLYNHNIANIKVSMSGEAKDYIFGFSNIHGGKTVCLKASDYSAESPLCIFIYVGELEEKLKNVAPKTWKRLVSSDTNQDIICYYISSACTKSKLSQEEQNFTCKTLKEVLANVKKSRMRKRNNLH